VLGNTPARGLSFRRNNLPPGHHFLSLRLEGRNCNRDAIGARVEVHLPGCTTPLMRTLHAGDGYLAQSSKQIHFGLGDATQVAKLVVRWPGGKREEFANPEPDHRYLVVQGTGRLQDMGIRTPRVELAA